MARLYVANCTGQHRIVNYRLDYTVDDQGRRTSERLVPFRTLTIMARQQVPFGGDMHPSQIADIVQQLEQTCGAVNSMQVRTAKKMGVVKMIWQEDRPIPLHILKDVVGHNVGLLSEQGANRREQLALVADQQLTQLLGKTPAKVELEFEQVEDGNDDLPTPGRLTEGLRVRHDGASAPSPTKRRKARATRRAAA